MRVLLFIFLCANTVVTKDRLGFSCPELGSDEEKSVRQGMSIIGSFVMLQIFCSMLVRSFETNVNLKNIADKDVRIVICLHGKIL